MDEEQRHEEIKQLTESYLVVQQELDLNPDHLAPGSMLLTIYNSYMYVILDEDSFSFWHICSRNMWDV